MTEFTLTRVSASFAWRIFTSPEYEKGDNAFESPPAPEEQRLLAAESPRVINTTPAGLPSSDLNVLNRMPHPAACYTESHRRRLEWSRACPEVRHLDPHLTKA